MLLEGKSAVITGAGSGVGRASALLFAREGARVVCADVREDWAKETVSQVEAEGNVAVAASCDVTREDDVLGAVELATTSFGRLDVVFNNAGVATPAGAGPLESYDDEQWDRLMRINLRGVFYGTKHAIARFKAQGDGGAIVNTASVAGMVGWGGTIYGASKGGVIQLTRGAAIEAAPFDIRVNAICPAAMPHTNFMVEEPGQFFEEKSAEWVERLSAVHPLGRPITAEDCAGAAAFLASDLARNITGVALPIDGGYTAR